MTPKCEMINSGGDEQNRRERPGKVKVFKNVSLSLSERSADFGQSSSSDWPKKKRLCVLCAFVVN